MAEKQKCALFTISCGDLGTEPEQLEVKLKEVFEYAVTWKAILLLDEADIFLQERDVHDVSYFSESFSPNWSRILRCET